MYIDANDVGTSTFIDDAYIMHINRRTCCDVVSIVIYSVNTQNGACDMCDDLCALCKHHQQMLKSPRHWHQYTSI
jgi:hypothetical protein